MIEPITPISTTTFHNMTRISRQEGPPIFLSFFFFFFLFFKSHFSDLSRKEREREMQMVTKVTSFNSALLSLFWKRSFSSLVGFYRLFLAFSLVSDSDP